MSIQPISTMDPLPSKRSKVEPHSFDSLPLEMFMVIFSQGEWSLKDLGRVCRVSKRFNQIVGLNSALNPNNSSSSFRNFFKNLWKKALYNELSFNDAHWRDLTFKEVVEDEIPENDFKTLPLEEVVHDLREIKGLYPIRKATKSLMLVRIPKILNSSMSLMLFEYIFSSQLHRGKWEEYKIQWIPAFKEVMKLDFIGPSGRDEFVGPTNISSRWVLLTTNPLINPDNREMVEEQKLVDYMARKNLVGYKLATLIDISICGFALVAKAPDTIEIFDRIKRNYKSFDTKGDWKEVAKRVFVRNFIDPENKV